MRVVLVTGSEELVDVKFGLGGAEPTAVDDEGHFDAVVMEQKNTFLTVLDNVLVDVVLPIWKSLPRHP